MKSIVFVLLSFATFAVGCGTASRSAAPESPPVSVSTSPVELADISSSFEAGGVVRAVSTAIISSRLMSPVVSVLVRPGDRVHRGAPLVTLDAREVTANRARAAGSLTSAVEAARAAESDVRAAEAVVTLARATHDRVRSLHEKRSATSQELDQAVAALDGAGAHLNGARARAASASAARDAAQAAVDAAAIATSYTILTAPFDGVVTERSVDSGSMATPGTPLMTVEDTTGFRLEVPLDEARARQVAIGQTADVALDVTSGSPERWTRARVAEVARVDAASHSFVLKLDLPHDAGLRSGLFGRARFAGPARRRLTVPPSAAVRRGQLTFVFVVDADNRARLQPVSAGVTESDRLEVLAGVREHDRVVTEPAASLVDGARVTGVER